MDRHRPRRTNVQRQVAGLFVAEEQGARELKCVSKTVRPFGWFARVRAAEDFVPSRAPELNPIEDVWHYLRSNWLSNRVFDTYGAIVGAARKAWQKLIAMPESITSIGMREWAHVGQSL